MKDRYNGNTEEITKVAIQGTAGAFHELAAQTYFNRDIVVEECGNFDLICRKVSEGFVDYGVMAIENTIAGSLLHNYSLINTHRLKIVGEIYLHIEMQLMALPQVKMRDIRNIISHPIAIAQCRDYLDTLSEEIKILEASDTAGAARMIKEQQLTDSAAIAGHNAAGLYGLKILMPNIHINKQNFTRFLILSKQGVTVETNNKSSLCLEMAHRSGSLADILNVWARENINLTKIQSVPIIGKPSQYWFYMDLEWDNAMAYRRAMYEAAQLATSLSILGEYERRTHTIQKVNKI